MAIDRITEQDVLACCRQTLGLQTGQQSSVEDICLIAGLVRRSAGINCPCSRTTLRASLLESLQHLTTDIDSLSDFIDAAIEGLIVGGDLLELNDVATDDTAVRGTWVFSAPPSFVERPSGDIFLFGIVADQDVFLPHSLSSRIMHNGFTRTIVPESDEDLVAELQAQGLQQLSNDVWLKSPKKEAAAELLGRYERSLAVQPLAGTVADLMILDPERPPTYYRSRWTAPKKQSGSYLARRPQEFGAPQWGFVALENGLPVRFLDLPLERTRWRGCDVAWHLQMAIDYCRHAPQRYHRSIQPDGVRFDFFSPLPQWAERRLMILGRAFDGKNSLISYLVFASEAEVEEHFLQTRLWLVPDNQK